MANTTNLDLVKPAGTDQALISVLNGNSDKIDQFAGDTNTSLESLADGLAIVANGDVHGAISSGQYVYVRNHTTLAEGLYTATSAIAANASLSTSNLTADSDGGFNSLSQAIANLVKFEDVVATTGTTGNYNFSNDWLYTNRVIIGIYQYRDDTDYETASVVTTMYTHTSYMRPCIKVRALDDLTIMASKTFKFKVAYLQVG